MLDALWERGRVDIQELNNAIKTLREQLPQQTELTEQQFSCGLDHEEISELLDISVPTVKHDSVAAKARLKILMSHDPDTSIHDHSKE